MELFVELGAKVQGVSIIFRTTSDSEKRIDYVCLDTEIESKRRQGKQKRCDERKKTHKSSDRMFGSFVLRPGKESKAADSKVFLEAGSV